MYKYTNKLVKQFGSSKNPFSGLEKKINIGNQTNSYFSLPDLKDPKLETLPYSIRVLLESAIRNCDDYKISQKDVQNILNWEKTSEQDMEIPFKPARVVMQDFTGVPAVVDLAAMRDAMERLGKDPQKINPLVPVDLVIDHSVQADISRQEGAYKKNEEIEFQRNYERFEFLKWGQSAFDNFLIVPPGSGIVHQVNLEYLARVAFEDKQGLLYPDSCIGTDSHTTMINGLGVAGWGVGGIEAESVMLGEAMSMVLPKVVGFKLTGKLNQHVTATDMVLTCVQMLRKRGVVGQFVEFFGEGVQHLSLADRATIANMAPEYGATMGFFPVDEQAIAYMKLTGRSASKIAQVEQYLKAQNLFRVYDGSQQDPVFSGDVMTLDLSHVEPCLSGPKRPHDKVNLSEMKSDFNSCLSAKTGFKGFGLKPEEINKAVNIKYQGNDYELKHGSVVIAAITSCTNTSNPDSMLMAGLVCKKAVEQGLSIAPYVKTTLSPGSQVITQYFDESGLTPFLNKLGFYTAGYGCMTCIGNSGELDKPVQDAILNNDLCVTSVLSGNRNFEARVHQNVKGNYLASPPLVVAYALAGTVDIDFEKEPIGQNKDGKNIFLKDIWPTRDETAKFTAKYVNAKQFSEVYSKIAKGTDRWNALEVKGGKQYNWNEKSTYIHNPPYFQETTLELNPIKDITSAYCLLNLGDSITTDHISPAGKISKNSPAARYLEERGITQDDYNSYGSRRGNDEIMARGTFANVRLINKLVDNVGSTTIHHPTNKELSVFDASDLYQKAGEQLIVLGGAEYGSGSSRDWAAKGPKLLGINGVIAQSYERIHRSNLVGMGILPMQYKDGQTAQSLGLTGTERFNIKLNGGDLQVGQDISVTTDCGKSFTAKVRLDTPVEIDYYKNGGILQYVLRKLVREN